MTVRQQSTTSISPLIDRLEPGDVIFFATDKAATFGQINSADFQSDFRVLAAFAQGLPYVLGATGNEWSPLPVDYKPWYHVAICTQAKGDGPPLAIGFHEGAYDRLSGVDDGSNVEEDFDLMREFEVVLAPGTRVDVLRTDKDVGPAVAAARGQVATKTRYAVNGLLAFALATQARMMAKNSLRTETLNRSYGAHVLARDVEASAVPSRTEESCVTAVTKSLEASVGPIAFDEPEAPDAAAAEKAFQFEASATGQAIQALVERVTNSAGGAAIAAIRVMNVSSIKADVPSLAPQVELLQPLVVNSDVVAKAQRDLERRLDQLGDFGVPAATPGSGGGVGGLNQYPGTGKSTADYLTQLSVAVDLAKKSPGDLVASGKAERNKMGVPGAEHLVVSPAMLWDALVGAKHGFTQVV